MSNTNKAKAEQLGMPWGTASNRLRKQIMFSLLVRYGDNHCFKCGEEINDVAELTVEHKEPWFNVDPELFWDINNIAFSHAKCNRPHSYNPTQRKQCPDGQGWCSYGKHFADLDSFYEIESKSNGRSSYCKDCNTLAQRDKRARMVE